MKSNSATYSVFNVTALPAAPAVMSGYDRITLWLDRAELPISRQVLRRHCTRLKVKVGQMKANARWKLRLMMFQPTLECLQLLAVAVGRDVNTLLTYIEIACDVPASTKAESLRMRDCFLADASIHYQRQKVLRNRTCWYYGRRTSAINGQRRGNVLTIYADRPSKINNAKPAENASPCLHIEWRATGSAAIEAANLVTLTDLIAFDHKSFWNTRLRMYKLPCLTDLGRLLATASGAGTNVSGTALRKRATRWKNRHNINGKFVMHNALKEFSTLAEKLKKIPFWDWLQG